jgi:ferrous iron transport protein B
MYLVGIAAVLVAAICLKKTKYFHGPASPFVMELPQYHIPSPKTVLLHTWERLWSFIKKAGTILFLACIVMWFLSSYGFGEEGFGLVDSNESLLASVGNVIRYIFVPLGFGGAEGGWQAAAASLSGFSAKEAIVSTLAILYGGDISAAGFTPLTAFSFMLFVLLYFPCVATIATLHREAGKQWAWFTVFPSLFLAWLVAFLVYQIGSIL